MSLVETRYAEAFVNLALERNQVEQYKTELYKVLDIYQKHNELKAFLLNMKINANIKKETIEKVFNQNVSSEVRNLLKLLLDKKRIKYLPGIVEQFSSIADKKRNILNITVYSAFPLEDSQVERIKDKYRKIYNAASVKADIRIDKNLIGGIKIKIGDKIIDATIVSKVEMLKEMLEEVDL
jgi:F-type H+-transporting ATPase subunit delta